MPKEPRELPFGASDAIEKLVRCHQKTSTLILGGDSVLSALRKLIESGRTSEALEVVDMLTRDMIELRKEFLTP
jgi:hypothetical protein